MTFYRNLESSAGNLPPSDSVQTSSYMQEVAGKAEQKLGLPHILGSLSWDLVLRLGVSSKGLLHTNIPISEPQPQRFLSGEGFRNQVSCHTLL